MKGFLSAVEMLSVALQAPAFLPELTDHTHVFTKLAGIAGFGDYRRKHDYV
jgi:hypothetical protein